MVYAYQRLICRPGKRFACRKAHQQRAYKPRPVGYGNGVYFLQRHLCFGKRFIYYRQYVAYMVARGNFRHYAAVFTVNRHLRGNDVA